MLAIRQPVTNAVSVNSYILKRENIEKRQPSAKPNIHQYVTCYAALFSFMVTNGHLSYLTHATAGLRWRQPCRPPTEEVALSPRARRGLTWSRPASTAMSGATRLSPGARCAAVRGGHDEPEGTHAHDGQSHQRGCRGGRGQSAGPHDLAGPPLGDRQRSDSWAGTGEVPGLDARGAPVARVASGIPTPGAQKAI